MLNTTQFYDESNPFELTPGVALIDMADIENPFDITPDLSPDIPNFNARVRTIERSLPSNERAMSFVSSFESKLKENFNKFKYFPKSANSDYFQDRLGDLHSCFMRADMLLRNENKQAEAVALEVLAGKTIFDVSKFNYDAALRNKERFVEFLIKAATSFVSVAVVQTELELH